MNAEENLKCPACGAPVATEDKFCKNCGANLRRAQEPIQEPTPPEAASEKKPEEQYVRKYSVPQRLWKALVSPSSAMRDIALSPDYGGPVLILLLQTILSGVALAVAFQKIHVTGPSEYVAIFWNFMSGILVLALFLAMGMLVAFWLVKTALVRTLCDNTSQWDFKTVAAVTGYAYIADVTIQLVGLAVTLVLLPEMTANLSDIDAARMALANFTAQTRWIKLISLPLGVVGLVWKSYLGGVGTRFGTKNKCSFGTGFAVFLVLGLVGFLISALQQL